MKKVAVLLAPGFEEAEAIVTLDILRRLHIDVETLWRVLNHGRW